MGSGFPARTILRKMWNAINKPPNKTERINGDHHLLLTDRKKVKGRKIFKRTKKGTSPPK
jgi:hypothetical protein